MMRVAAVMVAAAVVAPAAAEESLVPAISPSPRPGGYVGTSGNSFADSAVLSESEWAVELTPMAGKALSRRSLHDTLEFGPLKVTSKRLAAEAYEPADFSAGRSEEGAIVWEAMQVRADHGVALWRGRVEGETIRGTLSQYSLDGVQGDAREFSFVGRKLGSQAAANFSFGGTPAESKSSVKSDVRSEWNQTLTELQTRLEAGEDKERRIIELEGRVRELEDENKTLRNRIVRQQELIAEGEDRIRQYEGDIETTKSVFHSKHAAFTSIKAELDLKESELSGMRLAYQELEQEYLAAKDTIENLERDRRDYLRMQTEFGKLKEERASLNTLGEGAKRRISELNAQVHTLNLNNERLSKELTDTKQIIAERDKQIEWLESKVQKVAPEHEQLQQQMTFLQEEYEKEKLQRKAVEGELGSLKIQMQEQRNKLLIANASLINTEDLLEKARAELRQSQTDREKAAKELEKLQHQLRDKDFELQEIYTQSEQAVMQSRMEAMREAKRAEERSSELREAGKNVMTREKELLDLERSFQKAEADWKAERAKLLRQAETLQEDLDKRVLMLEENYSKAQAELEAAREKAATAEAEAANLRRTFADQRLSLQELQQQAALADGDKQELLRRIDEQTKAQEQLQSLLDGARLSEGELRNTIGALEREVADARKQVEHANSKSAAADLKSAREEISALRQQLIAQQQQVTGLEKRLLEQKKTFEEARLGLYNELNEARALMEEYKSSHGKLTDRLSETGRDQEALEAQLLKIQSALASRDRDLMESRTAHDQTKEQLAALQALNDQFNAKLAEHQDAGRDRTALESQLLRLQSALDAREKELEVVRSQNEDAKQRLAALQAVNDQLSRKLQNIAVPEEARSPDMRELLAERNYLAESIQKLEVVVEKREVALARSRERERELASELDVVRAQLQACGPGR